MPAYACVASLRSTLHAGECRLPLHTGTHGTMGTAASGSAGCMLTQLRGEELSYTTLLLCPKNNVVWAGCTYQGQGKKTLVPLSSATLSWSSRPARYSSALRSSPFSIQIRARHRSAPRRVGGRGPSPVCSVSSAARPVRSASGAAREPAPSRSLRRRERRGDRRRR